MPSIGRPFGSGKDVPRSKEALAALGVEMKGSKGDRGSQGPEDEIRLSAEEHEQAIREILEYRDVWNREDLKAWLNGIKPNWGGHLIDQIFLLNNDGSIECKKSPMRLTSPRITELPPNLYGDTIEVGSGITKLPRGMHVFILDLRGASQLKELPSDLVVHGYLMLRNDNSSLEEEADRLGLPYRTFKPV